MKKHAIADCGEVVLGARKHLYAGKMQYEDIKDLSILEQLKTATKVMIWEKPEIVVHEDPFIDFVTLKIWESLRAKLPAKLSDRIEEYVTSINDIRERCNEASTEKEIMAVVRDLRWGYDQKLMVTKKIRYYQLTRFEMEEAGFGMSDEEIVERKVRNRTAYFTIDEDCEIDPEFRFIYRRRTDESGGDYYNWNEEMDDLIREGIKILTKDGKIICVNAMESQFNILCEEIREEELKKLEKQKTKGKRKRSPRAQFKHLENIVISGCDVRHGAHVSAEQLMDTFGLRGIQFGNWLASDHERQQVIDMAFDALSDLSEILNIDPTSIGGEEFGALAFGARGIPGSSALGHYEPGKRVIALTRLHGNQGVLGHEWMHMIDHMTSNDDTTLYSEDCSQRGAYPELDRLIDEIKHSQYYEEARRIDRWENRQYWSQNCELLARAFQGFLFDRLFELEKQNDYLTALMPLEQEEFSPYPSQSERESFNPLFKEFFESLIKKGIFHPRIGEIKLPTIHNKKKHVRESVTGTWKGSQIAFM